MSKYLIDGFALKLPPELQRQLEMPSFLVSCQKPEPWHVNLNLRRLHPAEKVREVEASALGVFNMHLLTSCVPALYPVLREIKLKAKNTVHAREGFPCFPGGRSINWFLNLRFYKDGSVFTHFKVM